ncbi:HD domain-containing protein [Alcaligenes sp. WGS1538]|uniref:HD domain-containing protein n=1 Tax=Alcaligenes sp. WGS1538 TaxID=3366811 RepID=UPI00372D7A1D
MSSTFHPYPELAAQLLPHSSGCDGDGSHDLSHLQRVWKNVCAIQAQEGGDLRLLLAAALLHDCVAVEKSSPLRAQASTLAAEKAGRILADLGWSAPDQEAVMHAVRTHSFSAGLPPLSLEARILQDADRLDAIGALGIARCFYTAGRMGSSLYHPQDPEAQDRPLDDARYALDHFPAKLLKLAEGFQTETGQRLARERQARMQRYLRELLDEL